MRRIRALFHSVTYPLAFLAALLACSTGCTTSEDASVRILFNQLPNAGCVGTPNINSTALGAGIIDTNAQRGYIFTPLVQNIATAMGTITDSQRSAIINGANIRTRFDGLFDDAELSTLRDQALVDFRRNFTFPVLPNNGLSAMQFEIISTQLLTQMQNKLAPGTASDVELEIQLFGTLGGGSIESQEFVYHVTVCNSCLLNLLPAACEAITDKTGLRNGGSCQGLQDPIPDGVVDCCLDANSALRCPVP